MTLINKTKLLTLIFSFLLISSCRKATGEVLEKTALKEVGSEIIEKITGNSLKELSELGLSKEIISVIKNFDDDLSEQFLKHVSQNKLFLSNLKANPAILKTWKKFAYTDFGSDIHKLRWIHKELANSKFTFRKAGRNVNIFDSKTNNYLGTFEKDRIIVIAGKGGKDLNPLLNIHPLLPQSTYKVGKNSFVSDSYGRIMKIECPLLAKGIKVERSVIQQGLSKKLKNGIIKVDEFNNPINVQAGYPDYKDDGGHLLANIFGGPSEQINYLPMSNEANKKSFKKLETYLSKCISEGKKVSEFKVNPKYKGKIGRPDNFYISYYVDGKYYSQKIINN
jgi:hypothetical protein